MAASYSVLSPKFYKMSRAEVIFRVLKNGVAITPFRQFGDVDKFGFNLTSTKVARYRKNARVRTKAKESVTQIDSAVSMTVYQFTQFVRMMSILGVAVDYEQDAGDFEYQETAAVGLFYVGVQDIEVTGIASGSTIFTAGQFRTVDPELGIVEVFELPDGLAEGAVLTISGTKGAIAKGTRMKAKVGAQSSNTLEIIVRDVGEDSIPQALHLYQVELSPANEVAFIGEDDFDSVEFTGSALDTSQGLGVLMDLRDE